MLFVFSAHAWKTSFMNTYGERLEIALAVKRPEDKNARQWLADQLDISVQAVGQVITGKTKALTAENHEKAVRALGCSGLWLATGQGECVSVHALTPSPSPGAPEVRVPLLANSGSMGMGSDLQHDDVLVGHIALSELWVMRRLRPTNASALRFIHAYGDSMSPTFEDGDILLVDTGMRDPKTVDGVYVMAANERVYIKRVRQRMDGAMEISSDNITVKTVDVLNGDHAIEILGRVVWCWNGRKL
jgi:phage repressor protein C with HTH and peptisase S24 domain